METESAEIQCIYKKRRPWLAVLLSFFSFGLGQLYNGQPKKCVFFILYPFLLILLAIPFTLSGFIGLVVHTILAVCIFLFMLIDAAVSAMKAKQYKLRWYNKWYIYFLLFIFLFFGRNQLYYIYAKTTVLPFIQPFKIVTGSMLPNIRVGDRIIADMTYDVLSDGKRGDVIVAVSPEDKQFYIKRIIALPKERITIYEGTVYINGQPLEELWELVFDPNFHVQAELHAKYAVGDEYVVPDGHVFLLGDNRDRSLDSRHWGAVDVNKIKGKVLYIFWSDDISRIGQEFD